MSSKPVPKISYSALLGRLIQHHRERIGLSQSQVAAALGIMQPAYSRIEKGDTSITVTQLRAASHALQLSPSHLLNEADRWAQQLRGRGVTVTDEKDVPKAALLVGLAILAAALLGAAG
ncbi:MAG TPA: helix-turn-helix transcriptional regulator [Rhizomicrobium sp.]|nr:helix-turn-helix transcriptional regulator [Rhizomicrobium sp.]